MKNFKALYSSENRATILWLDEYTKTEKMRCGQSKEGLKTYSNIIIQRIRHYYHSNVFKGYEKLTLDYTIVHVTVVTGTEEVKTLLKCLSLNSPSEINSVLLFLFVN